jgi:DNA-binding MarR family transcriptional regulator
VVRDSSTPPIESDSSTVTLRSASSRCWAAGDRPAHARDPAGEPDRRRQHEQRHQRELPAQREHRDERGDRGGEVRGDRRGGRGDDGLHAADVVGDPRLHLTGAGAGEEGDRLALQVREHVGAQPVHDLLADLRRDQGLGDAQHGCDGGDGDHADHEPDEQGQVPLRQGVVDDGAQQERRGHRRDRRQRDQRGDDDDGPAVRCEQARDPPQRDLAGLRLLRCGDGGRRDGRVVSPSKERSFRRFTEVTSSWRNNTICCYRVPMQEQEEWEKQESLSDSFRAVSRRLRIQSQKALAPWEVTPGQARALGVLSRHGPVRLGTLSEHLRIAPRSATEVADALETRELVERRADPADRRATLVALTPAARRSWRASGPPAAPRPRSSSPASIPTTGPPSPGSSIFCSVSLPGSATAVRVCRA